MVMMRTLAASAIGLVMAGGAVAAPVFQPPRMTVPQGFVVEVVAAPPLVRHPMMAGFDDRGRLFVTESSGVNFRGREEYDRQLPNSVRRLEDIDGDGVFDKVVEFADKMTYPHGILWHDNALFIASPPNLWRIEDTDGDGVADRRKALVTGFHYGGNGADVHGPYLHPNGRLYLTDGRWGGDIKDVNGKLIAQEKAARIYSSKADGSDVRVFTPEGEILGTVNLFYGRPRGDVLTHWVLGGVYPRDDQETALAQFRRTGDLLPHVFNYGHVAVSGVERYQSGALDPRWKGDVFVSIFNTQEVVRSTLVARGTTFGARTEPFFKIHDPDAHVTDVLEDADGSLLVVDTGSWYGRCPTSMVIKPDGFGAIYRIRKAGPRPTGQDPRGTALDWKADAAELAKRLDDARPVVRDRTIAALAERGEAAVPTLTASIGGGSVLRRQNAVWALTRIGSAEARAAIRKALGDRTLAVRLAATASVATTADKDALPAMVTLLGDPVPSVRRTAADALGEMGDPAAADALLRALERPVDRFHEHALMYALMQIGPRDKVARGLMSSRPDVRRRTLVVLDQMSARQAGADHTLLLTAVLAALDHANVPLRDAAAAIAARHADWNGEVANRLLAWVTESRLTTTRLAVVSALAPRLSSEGATNKVVTRLISDGEAHLVRTGLGIVARASQPRLDPDWVAGIERALADEDGKTVLAALGAVQSLGGDRFAPALVRLANDTARAARVRLKALGVVLRASKTVDAKSFAFLDELLASPSDVGLRTDAARVVADAPLAGQQLAALAPRLPRVGPVERGFLIKAFSRSNDRAVGMALAAVGGQPGALAGVPLTDVQQLFARFPADVQKEASALLASAKQLVDERQTRLGELENAFLRGDASRGAELYRSGKGACITCHQIGALGRTVGPDLSAIGTIRQPRDLFESILYPSATLARDFEPYVVEFTTGDARTGVIARETPETLTLADATGETPFPRKTIRSVTPGEMSIMPEGLDQAFTKDELIDLVSFLKSLDGRGASPAHAQAKRAGEVSGRRRFP
jgi:putative heme-binding domain-containing protein